MAWPKETIGGVQYYVFMGRILFPVEPDAQSEMAQILLHPQGGMGIGVDPIEKGDKGDPPTLRNITVNELAYNSATPASASFTVVAPGVYDMTVSLHKGAPGANGSTVLDPANWPGAVAGQMLVVNGAKSAFELISPKVGDRYIPASLLNAPSGNPGFTIGVVSVPAQPFAWRPEAGGQIIVTPTGADLRVDFVARIGNETSGNIITRGFGLPGLTPPPIGLSGIPPCGPGFTVNDGYDRIAANVGPTPVYFRIERRSGAQTFTTSNVTTDIGVKVRPIP